MRYLNRGLLLHEQHMVQVEHSRFTGLQIFDDLHIKCHHRWTEDRGVLIYHSERAHAPMPCLEKYPFDARIYIEALRLAP